MANEISVNSVEVLTNQIVATFKANVESVHRLVNFDRVLLDICIRQVSSLADRIERAGVDKNHPRLGADKILQTLKTIQTNDSMRLQYEEMHNQCLVLLVSYFGLSIKDLLSGCLSLAVQSEDFGKLDQQEIKIRASEFRSMGGDFPDRISELLIGQKGTSFQDMKSIGRAFDDYFGLKLEKNDDANNLVVAQACRHVIVHSGGKADAKLIKQIADAVPRTIKLRLIENKRIQFNPDEIKVVGQSMVNYLTSVSNGLLQLW